MDPYNAIKKFEITYMVGGGLSNPDFPGFRVLVPGKGFNIQGWKRNPQRKASLTGFIVGITEDGYNEPNWFNARLFYPSGSEVDVERHKLGENYGNTRRYFGSDDVGMTEKDFLEWLKSHGFSHSEVPLTERVGVG